MKEVIITGGRDYEDRIMVAEVLDFLNPNMVIQGGASGADALAREWAESEGVECITYHADWDQHGKVAGPMRNREMIEAHPQAVVVAFPGGKGTADCVRQARVRNRIILQVHK